MALPEFALKAGREQYSWEMSPQVPGVVAKGCQKNVRLTYAEVLLLQNYVKAGVHCRTQHVEAEHSKKNPI